MGPVIVPVLTVLAGVAVRAIAYAELLARLRWQERQQRALTELAPARSRPGASFTRWGLMAAGCTWRPRTESALCRLPAGGNYGLRRRRRTS
jgi:hypothetical protein